MSRCIWNSLFISNADMAEKQLQCNALHWKKLKGFEPLTWGTALWQCRSVLPIK